MSNEYAQYDVELILSAIGQTFITISHMIGLQLNQSLSLEDLLLPLLTKGCEQTRVGAPGTNEGTLGTCGLGDVVLREGRVLLRVHHLVTMAPSTIQRI